MTVRSLQTSQDTYLRTTVAPFIVAYCIAGWAFAGDGAGESVIPNGLSKLSVWDDGLSEISYYRAVDRIYGRDRSYTRVHLLNRQWMDAETGVKAVPDAKNAVPVFKLNIAEEIPTENYNYRYLTTLFLRRPDLSPFKLVVSSQEWCGTTFKHLRWNAGGADGRSFSYFSNEGDRSWQLDAEIVPFEALFIAARDVVAIGEARSLKVLATMRSIHEVEPKVRHATLVLHSPSEVTVAAGHFRARRVDVEWDGPLTGFVVESAAPHRLLRYRAGPMRGELKHIERRAYWDRDRPSRFHRPGDAP